jgi:tetratricopeptide (TPR) repeat protein
MAIALGACQTFGDAFPGGGTPSNVPESNAAGGTGDAQLKSPDRQVAEAHFRLGQGLEEAGDIEGAVADYETAAALGHWPLSPSGGPNAASPQAGLARICEGANPPAIVVRACTAVIADLRFGPNRLAEFLNRRAAAEFRLGDPQQALTSIDAAQKFNSGHPETLLLRGRVLEALGQDRQALSSYDRALFGRPGFAEALLARGRLLARMGFAADAEVNFDAVLSDPQASTDHPEAYRDRALLHCRMGRSEEATVGFQVWAALSPDPASALRDSLEAHGQLRNPAVAGAGSADVAALARWIGDGCPDE